MRFYAADGWRSDSIMVDGIERLNDAVWADPRTHEVCLVNRNEQGSHVVENGDVKTHVVIAKKLKIVKLHNPNEGWVYSRLAAILGRWC